MLELFALIGMFVLLWFISKKVTKLVNWITNNSIDVRSRSITTKKNILAHKEMFERANKNTANKIRNITGEVSHVVYTDAVRQEIERLLGEIEKVPPRKP